MKRQVAITGIGIVSPLGNSREESWRHVLAGKSSAAKITQFDAKDWPTTFACEVKNFSLSDDAVIARHRPLLNRPSEFGAQAALEALLDSKIALTETEKKRFGISLGSGIGALRPVDLAGWLAGNVFENVVGKLSSLLEARDSSSLLLRNHPGTLANILAARWGARGPVSTIHTACASSGQSVGHAYMQIARGDADVMLCGGADSLAGELLLAGFCLLGALSRRNDNPSFASRPFDKGRDGFVASEGAAMLVLEDYDRASKRGADIYATISGYGETESAYRITDLPEDGRGIHEAMALAIEDSGLVLQDIDYINAHGTSTELNDRVETLAIWRLFQECGKLPLVSSTKSQVGHLISAAGAMEAAFCALALRDQVVPPTINFEKTDCIAELDYVPNTARKTSLAACLSNSVGFGGTNSVITFERDHSPLVRQEMRHV